MADEWLDFDDVAQLIADQLKCSTGLAQKLARDASASGEVQVKLWGFARFAAANIRPGVLERYGGKPSINFYQFNRIDLLDWLGRTHGAQQPADKPTRGPSHAQRKRGRQKQAALDIWGAAGPPAHLSDKAVATEIGFRLGEVVNETTARRAVGRRKDKGA